MIVLDTSSVPSLIDGYGDDHSSSSSEQEEEDEENLPDWIKEGRAANNVIVEFANEILEEFKDSEVATDVITLNENEIITEESTVCGKTSSNHDSEAGRWNGIEISKDRVNEEEDCSIPARANESNTIERTVISRSTVDSKVSTDSTHT